MPPLFTVDDVAELLQVSRSTVYSLKRKDGWPHVLVGVKVRFTQEHLEEIIKLYSKASTQQSTTRPRIGTRARRNK
jgi:excisionase family DNA binding protein